jgi:MtN3 and saliva related transmembrane protein
LDWGRQATDAGRPQGKSRCETAAAHFSLPSKRCIVRADLGPREIVFPRERSLSFAIEIVGSTAAVITSLCWVPQILKTYRDRHAQGVSLWTHAALALGVFLWLVYGVFIGSWPMIVSNALTLGFVLAIVGMKLRFG